MLEEKYIQFHDGPCQDELRRLIGKEAMFIGRVTRGQGGEILKTDVAVKLRIRDSSEFYADSGIKLYRIAAESVNDSPFHRGERIEFEYDAVMQHSEAIYLE